MAPVFASQQPQGFVNKIQNIAIVGAGGQMGSHIVSAFQHQGKHKITAVTRPDSQNTLPEALDAVVKASYDDHAGLVAALTGQDALIVTMRAMSPPENQIRLIDAAVEAGVKFIMPNEYGTDQSNEPVANDTKLGPALRTVRKYIEDVGKGKTNWIALSCSFWYEFSLAGSESRYGFDFDKKTVTFFDDGRTKICTSTWPQAARAVARLFAMKIFPEHPNDDSTTLSQFSNKAVLIKSFAVSQRDMLDSILRVTGDEESDWTITHENSLERYNRGVKMLESGNMVGFGILLYTRVFFPGSGGDFSDRVANKLLDLPVEDMDEYTKVAMKYHEEELVSSRDRLQER